MTKKLDKILAVHKKGKILIENKVQIRNRDDLALVYTPGVAEVVKLIQQDPSAALKYTILGETVGMFTDGTAVLGLGNTGAVAGMPVMEGKAMIYRAFAGINAYPLLLSTTDVDSNVQTIANLAESFSLIHLEDISAPNCFELLDKLQQKLNIPVFHDDQYGTALIVLAGLINVIRFLQKKDDELKIVINGAGAAGLAIANVLLEYGLKDITLCDSRGIVSQQRTDLNPYKTTIINKIGKIRQEGKLADALNKTDVFIGVSVGNILTPDMVASMNEKPIIFALANPVPEILPSELKNFDGIIATGRSDFANQINNAIGYPGFVKGILKAGIKKIEISHIITAAKAIAGTIPEKDLRKDYIIPDVFNPNVVPNIVKSLA